MITNATDILETRRSQLQEIDETANTLSDGIKILNDDRERLVIEASVHQDALDSLTKNISTLKISAEEQAKVNAFGQISPIGYQALTTLWTDLPPGDNALNIKLTAP